MPSAIRLEGFALHAGTPASVTLSRHEGPISFGRGARRAELSSLRIGRTDGGVALTDERGFEIDLVEHLLAALAGLGIRRNLLAVVEGPELPILDGGARAFADALLRLEIPNEPPDLFVRQRASVELDDSSYAFEPAEGVEVVVETTFDHPAIGRGTAAWNGDVRTFCDEVAPARTFGFIADAGNLWARGRARLAARALAGDDAAARTMNEAVVAFDPSHDARSIAGSEPTKHKLLDLIGDLAFYGGPPIGRVVARRPGHTATHSIVPRAIARGILSRR